MTLVLPSGLVAHDLATSGEGWRCYRIPALTVAPGGDLLAFYDGRTSEADLPGNIAIMMRRSTDGGATWGPQEEMRRSPTPVGHGDPSVLVDRETGQVYCFHLTAINEGFWGSGTGSDPDDPDIQHLDYSVTSDDGRTWTHHRITQQVRAGHADWAGMFAASGEGIQLRQGLHRGRLIQQYVVRVAGANHALSVYSDDHGHTWRTSSLVGPGADENKAVELANGDVMLNSRAKPCRRVAFSHDGGATYGPLVEDPLLPDPDNNGSIIRAFPDAGPEDPLAQLLLFANAADPERRRMLTVRLSYDSGRTWPVSRIVDEEATGYSTLTPLPDGSYGLLYERAAYGHITYTSFSLDWLTGADS